VQGGIWVVGKSRRCLDGLHARTNKQKIKTRLTRAHPLRWIGPGGCGLCAVCLAVFSSSMIISTRRGIAQGGITVVSTPPEKTLKLPGLITLWGTTKPEPKLPPRLLSCVDALLIPTPVRGILGWLSRRPLESPRPVRILRSKEMKTVNSLIYTTSKEEHSLYIQRARGTRQGERTEDCPPSRYSETRVAVISGRVASGTSSPNAHYSDKASRLTSICKCATGGAIHLILFTMGCQRYLTGCTTAYHE